MKAAVALVIAAIGFYASVAWAGDAVQPGSAPGLRGAPTDTLRPVDRRAPAADTPAPKARSTAPKVPTLRLPGKTGREVICACGPIDRHA